MANSRNNWRVLSICLLLGVVTLAGYWHVVNCGFVDYDDPSYFSNNPHVQAGLTPQSIVWAFRTDELVSRYPLTWLSLMLDADLFGKGPFGPHFTNLLLHVANAILVFLVLRMLTGAFWRSALVAALFALHPLRVEAVAWISERKGVLSSFFWLLAMGAYVRSVQEAKRDQLTGEDADREQSGSVYRSRASLFQWLALAFFTCGLLSKPMVVTLPFVLLLLDYWPLERFTFATVRSRPAVLVRLVVEKIPYFLLSAVIGGVTMLTHEKAGAVVSLTSSPLSSRLANALVAYARYLGKTFWPVDLALPYPLPAHWPVGEVVTATLLVVGLSAVVLWLGRRHRYALVGWCWFLGTLVPVIGLVQWGDQAMADRFMYVPQIGLFIGLVWAVGELAVHWRVPKYSVGTVAVVVLVACTFRTWNQVHYWTSTETLFHHTLAVTGDNYTADVNLGSALDDQGKTQEALPLFVRAVKLAPHDPDGNYNLGVALLKLGHPEEAVAPLTQALKAKPDYVDAHINLGSALMKLGRLARAAEQFQTVIHLDPSRPEGYFNLGTLFMAESKLEHAIECFNDAIQLKPDYAEARSNLGIALMRSGKANEGIQQLTEVTRLQPTNSEAQFNLGLACLNHGDLEQAVRRFNESLRLTPGQAKVQYRLSQALLREDQTKEAVALLEKASRLHPDHPDILNELAWVLATDPDAEVRSGLEAVRLAGHACELTENQQAPMLNTLAAAYAETGQFSRAIATARESRKLAEAAGQKEVAAQAEDLLKAFQSGQPFRDSSRQPAH